MSEYSQNIYTFVQISSPILKTTKSVSYTEQNLQIIESLKQAKILYYFRMICLRVSYNQIEYGICAPSHGNLCNRIFPASLISCSEQLYISRKYQTNLRTIDHKQTKIFSLNITTVHRSTHLFS